MAASAERNVAASNLIAKKVAAVITKFRLPQFPDPVQMPPHHLLVSSNNRGGQPLTMMVIHMVIIPSFMDDGFDPSRTPVGFAVWFETAKAKTDDIERNLTAFGGSALFPPVERDAIQAATLSCSHFNVSLRCYRAQMTTVDGRVCIADKDPELLHVVERGHKWILLSEETPVKDQKMLSSW